jgi:hypothetical protein
MGNLYLRIIKDGGQITSGGSVVEVATPYVESDLFDLQFTQSADVMTICHRNHAPRELSRSSHTSWALATITFGAAIAAPTGVSSSRQNYGSSGTTKTYTYVVTAVDSITESESVQSAKTSITNRSLSTTITNTVTWSAVSGANVYHVYKTKGGVFGFIGRADSTTFVDDNIGPDISLTPQKNRILFDAAGKYPAIVTYFQQRLVLGQSDNEPQTLWMSQTGVYKNFNTSTPLRDDDSVTFTIAAREVNEVRHMMPLQSLIVLTSGGEWLVKSSVGDAITPTSINLEPQGYRGASTVPPISIGNTVIYLQSKGAIVRDLAYALDSDSYTGNDLTVLASHLFTGKTVVDWAFSQAPWSIIWAVLSDGSLAALTYLREHEVWGWSRHDTDGTYESVSSVSEGTEDAVYFVVKRTINGNTKRYIERLNSRVFTTVEDSFFVDSGLTFDGTHTGSTTMTLSGGTTWAHGESITLTASATTFVSGDVGNAIVLTVGNETLRCNITAYTSATVVTIQGARDIPTAFRSIALGIWSKAVDTLSGLGHLEGKTVSILADANVEVQQIVTSGTITITHPASKIHVGLAIQSDFETLEIENSRGTIQGKRKTISAVTLRVENTRGGKVGPSLDQLTEFKQRAYEAYGEPTELKTGDIQVTIPSRWKTNGALAFRQDDPLPVTILATIPEIEVGK